MMFSTTAGKPARLTETQKLTHKAGNLFSRKIWLPKLFYNALPFFYLAAGFMAFLATLYISEWFWVLPHYLLFSVACLHLGIMVYRRRRRPDMPDA
jgi:hypothetical protein